MLFESSLCKKIIDRFQNTSDPHIPKIISFLTSDFYSGERNYFEELYAIVPENIKTKWQNEIFSSNNGKHIGAWFEMILFGWLREIADVTLEPDLNGTLPDFLINLNGEEIIVEAKAIIIDKEQRKQDLLFSSVYSALNKIEKGFIVHITEMSIKSHPDISKLVNEVSIWLDSCPEDNYIFKDKHDNFINFDMIDKSNDNHLLTVGNVSSSFINPEPLKNPILKKLKKYRGKYPYIIAIYLESTMLSANEIKTALFGNEKVTIDLKNNKVSNSTIDFSGVHFHRKKILHKSVNGTLVFKVFYSDKDKRRFLTSRFIQNPYCDKKLNYNNFPVESSFVVKYKNDSKYEMGWTSKNK